MQPLLPILQASAQAFVRSLRSSLLELTQQRRQLVISKVSFAILATCQAIPVRRNRDYILERGAAFMDFLTPDSLPLNLQTAIAYRDLAAGQTLFHQGDQALAIYWVESGRIRLTDYTKDGQTINHYILRAHESFAEAALFSDIYECTAIADLPSRVAVLPKQPFLTALRDHSDLSTAFMAQLAQRIHGLKILLDLRSMRSARERVLRYLLLAAPSGQTLVNLDRSLKDIADDLGLTPEALSRALAQLQKEGAITRMKRQITLHKKTLQT